MGEVLEAFDWFTFKGLGIGLGLPLAVLAFALWRHNRNNKGE